MGRSKSDRWEEGESEGRPTPRTGRQDVDVGQHRRRCVPHSPVAATLTNLTKGSQMCPWSRKKCGRYRYGTERPQG